MNQNENIYKELLSTEKKAVHAVNRDIEKAYAQHKKIVLIYQMGKVGSSSYASSLDKHPETRTFHVHRMLPLSNLHMIQRFMSQGETDKALKERKWMEIYDRIILEKRPVYLISSFREPISRNISAFFENKRLFYEYTDDISRTIDIFLQKYDHNHPFTWFDQQMKKAIGFDIFDSAFDKENGYQVIEKGNIKLLLFIAELNNAAKESIIQDFLGLRNLSIQNKNVSSKKDYAIEYSLFKQQITLPESFVHNMLDNSYVHHFYKQEMILSFIEKWLRTAT